MDEGGLDVSGRPPSRWKGATRHRQEAPERICHRARVAWRDALAISKLLPCSTCNISRVRRAAGHKPAQPALTLFSSNSVQKFTRIETTDAPAMSTASGLINPIAVPRPLVGMEAPSASFPMPSGASPSEADISGSLCEATLRSAAAAGNARGIAATASRAFIALRQDGAHFRPESEYENPIPQNRNL